MIFVHAKAYDILMKRENSQSSLAPYNGGAIYVI